MKTEFVNIGAMTKQERYDYAVAEIKRMIEMTQHENELIKRDLESVSIVTEDDFLLKSTQKIIKFTLDQNLETIRFLKKLIKDAEEGGINNGYCS